jgi:hypothetical protein
MAVPRRYGALHTGTGAERHAIAVPAAARNSKLEAEE